MRVQVGLKGVKREKRKRKSLIWSALVAFDVKTKKLPEKRQKLVVLNLYCKCTAQL